MDIIRDQFNAGRSDMIGAFAELSVLARQVDYDHVTALHGRFFDGNVTIKRAFTAAVLLAEIRWAARDSNPGHSD